MRRAGSGIGEAAAFALREYDLPAIPTLPRRSPAEAMIAQALVGIAGVTLGQYGSIAVDVEALDPGAPVVTDLSNDAFVGIRTFLATASARGLQGPVKWQFVGPVTLGAALTRAGFEFEAGAVDEHGALTRFAYLREPHTGLRVELRDEARRPATEQWLRGESP